MNGMTIGGECEEIGVVKACQARIITDLEVAVEPVPEVLTTRGTVIATRPLAPDVMEVGIRPHDEITYLPGQYYRFQFRGYPGRYFSPTSPMDGPLGSHKLRLHVRRIPGGLVSPAIGHKIRRGHPVTLNGPFGSAYFRPGLNNRLILVGSGSGLCPDPGHRRRGDGRKSMAGNGADGRVQDHVVALYGACLPVAAGLSQYATHPDGEREARQYRAERA